MRKLLTVLLCLGLAGCATVPKFVVSVDSINNNEPVAQKSVVVTPGMKEISPEDLQFKEYASYVKRELSSKGYVLSDNMQTADVVVFLGYGISQPQEHRYTFAMPIFGPTGVSSASTMGSVSSNGVISATTTYTPSYGVVGSEPISGSYIDYIRQISLVAYDMKHYRETKQEKQVWKTEIISTGTSGDLRVVFPVMILATSQYIGDNTGKKVVIELAKGSKEFNEILSSVKNNSQSVQGKDKK
jgi:hypothetical protein